MSYQAPFLMTLWAVVIMAVIAWLAARSLSFSKKRTTDGPPLLSFGQMMAVRLVVALLLIAWILFVPDHPFGKGRAPSTGNAPAWIGLVYLAGEAVWSTLRQLWRAIKKR